MFIFNNTKIFATTLEEEAKKQIIELSNSPEYFNSKIRIMPDVHAGKGCTIGTTMTIEDAICPNLVGVDIGCGVLCLKLNKSIDVSLPELEKLDRTIRAFIPSGFNVRSNPINGLIDLKKLHAKLNDETLDRAYKSIATLGGGNHFIELAVDDEDYKYLVIHSGSRNLGHVIATHYQNKATEICDLIFPEDRNKALDYLIAYREEFGSLYNDYIHDMDIVQDFAVLNRRAMAGTITELMDWTSSFIEDSGIESIHNYIDIENKILRKGAISAQKDEKVIIPINMRDGSIIGIGKGNEEWNYSAPHGAGRLLSRTQAKKSLDLDEVKKSMDGIYTTSLHLSTIDEAPMAYKPIDEIVEAIKPTVEIEKIIKPIYNFKAK